MKHDKTIARCYTVKISSVFRSSMKIHQFSRTRTRTMVPPRTYVNAFGVRAWPSDPRDNSVARSAASERLCGKTQKAESALCGGLYIAGCGFKSGANRTFTPPAQYKPGKHVGIINKKHDEHGYTHTSTRQPPSRTLLYRATNWKACGFRQN